MASRAYHNEWKRKQRANNPEFREKERARSARRRARIAADPLLLAKERERKNANKRRRYAEDADFRAKEKRGTTNRIRRKRESDPEWHEEHLGKRRSAYNAQHKYRRTSPWTRIISSAKIRSKERGIACDLTHDWAKSVWTGRCELTGIEFELVYGTGKKRSLYSPSIDRIDPTKGYTQGNVRWILWALNAFKSDGTDEEILHIARALVARAEH